MGDSVRATRRRTPGHEQLEKPDLACPSRFQIGRLAAKHSAQSRLFSPLACLCPSRLESHIPLRTGAKNGSWPDLGNGVAALDCRSYSRLVAQVWNALARTGSLVHCRNISRRNGPLAAVARRKSILMATSTTLRCRHCRYHLRLHLDLRGCDCSLFAAPRKNPAHRRANRFVN